MKRYAVKFLHDLKQAVNAAIHKFGWGMLGMVAMILLFHWLRTKQLDADDVWDSAIACCIGMMLATVIEYSRLKFIKTNRDSVQ